MKNDCSMCCKYIFIFRKQTVDVFLHEEAVYGLSVDPINDNVFASACDDGKVVLYDIRASPAEGSFITMLALQKASFRLTVKIINNLI